MSIQSEIDRISGNVAAAYAAVEEMGGMVPADPASGNLAAAVRSIPAGGAAPGDTARPTDWLELPEPVNDEIYLLVHIPEGGNEELRFTATCAGEYTVELGTIEYQLFVPGSAAAVQSGAAYAETLAAEDYGNPTSDGMRQAVVRISGTNITTWTPAADQRIVEIKCRLPKGYSLPCGVSSTREYALSSLRYFTWRGKNNLTSTNSMFRACASLRAVFELDVSNCTNFGSMFLRCGALTALPGLNMSRATNTANMFNLCVSLEALPELDTSGVTTMQGMFLSASGLREIARLDTSKATTMSSIFFECSSLKSLKLNPDAEGWTGCDFTISGCKLAHAALVALFESLPAITEPHTLAVTGNPGVPELTEEEKAVATAKNWTLTL